MTPTPRYTLSKADKLRHKSLIDSLFECGNSMFEYPLKLMWKVESPNEVDARFRTGIPEHTGCFQFLISVPKRKRRRAVDRVLIRRRIREAIRLNRLPLLCRLRDNENHPMLRMAFIYIADKNTDYHLIERKVISLLNKLSGKLSELLDTDQT